jgi:hypothetical protein
VLKRIAGERGSGGAGQVRVDGREPAGTRRCGLSRTAAGWFRGRQVGEPPPDKIVFERRSRVRARSGLPGAGGS